MLLVRVDVDSSWTDPVAIGTLILAVATLVTLITTVRQARSAKATAEADRTRAQQQLQEEREQHRRDLLRQERVPQLMEVAKLYASVLATENLERHQAELGLQAMLWILPPGMARRLKRQFNVNLTPDDEDELARQVGRPIPHQFPEAEVFKELGANNRGAIAGAERPAKP